MKSAPTALVIGVGKGKADDADEEESESDDERSSEDDGAEKEDAAQALIDALKAGDRAAVADAFSTLHAICNEEKY